MDAKNNLHGKLIAAIRRLDLDACRLALDCGADPNGTFGDLILDEGSMGAAYVSSVLELAIVKSFSEAAELLLDRGASPRAPDADAMSPIITAASRGNLAVCRALLGKGAAVDDKGPKGETALTRAAEALHPAVCELLIRNGADVHAWRQGRGTPLHFVARLADPKVGEVIRILVAGGADSSYVRPDPEEHDDEIGDLTPFQCAVKSGNPYAVQVFLDLGEDPAQTTASGRPIMNLTAARSVAKILLAALTAQSIVQAAGNAPDTQCETSPAAKSSLGPL